MGIRRNSVGTPRYIPMNTYDGDKNVLKFPLSSMDGALNVKLEPSRALTHRFVYKNVEKSLDGVEDKIR